MGIFVNKNQFEVQKTHDLSEKNLETEVIDNEVIKDEVLLYLTGKES